MTGPTGPVQESQPHERSPLARGLLLAAGVAAGATLAGLYTSAEWPAWALQAMRVVQVVLVGLFAADRLVLLIRARRRRRYLLEHWLDLLIIAAAGVLVLTGGLQGRILPAAAMYLLISRAWLLVPQARLPVSLNILLGLTGLAAVAVLVLEYGFREPLPMRRSVLHSVQTVVVASFILDRLVRLELSRNRLRYLRENWVDFGLLALGGIALGVVQQLRGHILSAAGLYVIITQAYILISLVLRGVSVNLDFAGSGIPPARLLIGSFLVMCLAGSGLLMLPAATPVGQGLYYPDALFTATSATCVTGLVVRDTGSDFTLFGQAVILGLIQLGGLGIMLFGTVLALLVGKGLSMRSSDALGQMLGTSGIGQLARTVKFVVAVTIGLELAGAALLYPMFSAPQGDVVPTTGQAVWNSFFHSISSFCNAGFALYGSNMMAGVRSGWPQPLRDHWQVLGVMGPLIILGGLGFPVIEDCARYVRGSLGRLVRFRPHFRFAGAGCPPPRLSLHSKIVLTATVVLIVLGAGVLLAIGPRPAPEGKRIGRMPLAGPGRAVHQNPARWRNMPAGAKVQAAVFQSISARTAGFNTIDMREDLSEAGRLWMCWLMVIGGSPASTAGGMKTVTLAVLLVAAWSMIRRREEVEAFKRSITVTLLQRAITLALLYLGLVAAVTMLLCVAMPEQDFMRLLFEACSACGTVGLSTGITGDLTLFGKVVIIGGMFAGRLGPLTLLLALTSGARHVRYAYPTEQVVIG